MKLGDNTFNNDRLSLVMTKLPIKKLTNCSPYFTDLNIPIILKLKGNIKGRLISRIINLKKLFANLLKKTKMFTKPLTRVLRYVLINPSF